MSNNPNTINGLRGHLFEMLADLKDPNKKVEIERYTLANNIAQTVINSARVEIDAARLLGKSALESGFMPAQAPAAPPAITNDSESE